MGQPVYSGTDIPIRLPNPFSGQMTAVSRAGSAPVGAGATVGTKSAMAGMATAFAAMVVVEVVFWLLDKLTGGKLGGQAERLNAEPADMKRSAAHMQDAANAMKQQTGRIDALAKKLEGLWQGASQLRALKDLTAHNTSLSRASDEKAKLGHHVASLADTVARAQQSFLSTMKRYGTAAMQALTSLFGGFMAMVIAGLAVKLVMALLSRVTGEIAGQSAQIRSAISARPPSRPPTQR